MESIGHRPRLSDVLYADILREIESRKWSVGSRLPSEAELCAQFGVSRPVVREALGRLREEGIIRSRKGSGSFVRLSVGAPPEPSAKPHVAGRIVRSIGDIQKFYDYRISLEGEAAQMAAASRQPAAIQQLTDVTEQLAQAQYEGKSGIDEDIRFHQCVVAATANPFFIDAFERIAPDIRFIIELARVFLMRQPTRHIETVQHEHSEIVKAIASGDTQKSGELMRFHLRTAQARLFSGEDENAQYLWNKNL